MLRAIPYTSLWFGLILWFFATSSLLVATGWWLYENYLFAYHSQPTTGVVQRLYITTSHGRHGKSVTRHLAYHYLVDRMNFDCTTSVETNTYDALTVGQHIPILYLPAQPGNNRVDLPAEEQDVRVASWGLSLASLIVMVVGAFICRHYVRQNRRYRTLLATGTQCQGVVNSVPYDLVGKNRVARFYLTFTFTDNQAEVRIGRSWYLKKGDEVRWRAGNLVPVYFDPADSTQFTIDLKRAPASR